MQGEISDPSAKHVLYVMEPHVRIQCPDREQKAWGILL